MKAYIESVQERKKTSKCDICDYVCSHKLRSMIKHVAWVHEKKKPYKLWLKLFVKT